MTKKEREERALALVLEMDASPILYDPANAAAARQLYDLMRNTPETSDTYLAYEGGISRLHGRLSFPASLGMAGGFFAVGLLLTSPLWWGGGR
jgi:hypothetical protein